MTIRAPGHSVKGTTLCKAGGFERGRRSKNGGRARILLPGVEALEVRTMLSNWSGPLTSNTTFANTEVQNIVGNVDVEPGVTLTVQPGTVVQFNGGTSLTVDGSLLAQGTTSQRIVFTSFKDNSATGGRTQPIPAIGARSCSPAKARAASLTTPRSSTPARAGIRKSWPRARRRPSKTAPLSVRPATV